MIGFQENVPDGRTDERTDGTEFIEPSRRCRGSKKICNDTNGNAKQEVPPIDPHLAEFLIKL